MKRLTGALALLAVLGLSGCATAPTAPLAASTPSPSVTVAPAPVTAPPAPAPAAPAPVTLTDAERRTLDKTFAVGTSAEQIARDNYCGLSEGGAAYYGEAIGNQLDLSTEQVVLYLNEWCAS